MGTSAKYVIENDTFYTHYDGYENGAAARFLNAVKELVKPDPESLMGIKDVRGGFAFAFIRGNADVEPGHDVPTDYTYEIIKNKDASYEVNVYKDDRLIDSDDLESFVNKNNVLHESKIVKVAIPNYMNATVYDYATPENAFGIGKIMKKKADNFNEGNPNKKIFETKANAFLDAAF
jgi:hypothetical protein